LYALLVSFRIKNTEEDATYARKEIIASTVLQNSALKVIIVLERYTHIQTWFELNSDYFFTNSFNNKLYINQS